MKVTVLNCKDYVWFVVFAYLFVFVLQWSEPLHVWEEINTTNQLINQSPFINLWCDLVFTFDLCHSWSTLETVSVRPLFNKLNNKCNSNWKILCWAPNDSIIFRDVLFFIIDRVDGNGIYDYCSCVRGPYFYFFQRLSHKYTVSWNGIIFVM